MSRIEIRKTATAAQIVTVLHDYALAVQRVVINRLRERVRSIELEPARESLGGSGPESVVARVSGALDLHDVVQGCSGPKRTRTRDLCKRSRTNIDRVINV